MIERYPIPIDDLPEEVVARMFDPSKQIVDAHESTGIPLARLSKIWDASDPVNVGEFDKKVKDEALRRDYTGIIDELQWGTVGGVLRTAGAAVGTVSFLQRQIAKSPLFWPLYNTPQTREKVSTWFKETHAKLEEAANKLHDMASQWETQPAKNAGFFGFVANVTGQTLPMFAAAGGASLIAGPAGAWAVTASIEGDSWVREQMASNPDLTVEQLEMGRIAVGTINGLIELAQIGNILRLGKGAGKPAVQAFKQAVQDRAWKNIAAAGANLTADGLSTCIENGFQEAVQAMVGEGTATLVYGKELDVPGLISQAGQEFKYGAAGALGLGAGAIILNGVVGAAENITESQQEEPSIPLPPMAKMEEGQAVTQAATEEVSATPAPQVTPKSPEWGAGNKIVSREEYEQIKARQREAGRLPGGREAGATILFNPREWTDMVKVGLFHFEAGTTKFADWAYNMVNDIGVKAHPHLQRLWVDTQIVIGIRNSKQIRPQVKLTQHEELSRRAGAMEAVKEHVLDKGEGGHAAMVAMRGMQRGPLMDYQMFQEIELPQAVADAMWLDLARDPDITPMDRPNVMEAMENLLAGVYLPAFQAEYLLKYRPELRPLIQGRVDRSTYFEMTTSLWRAGLLTGMKTSMLNTLSNMTMAVAEASKDVPAVMVDSMMSLFTGERTVGLTMRGSAGGAVEGVVRGWNFLKTGYDERDVGGKWDFKKVKFGDSVVARGLQAYEEFVFRMMGAEDQPFYYGAKARSLFSQAIADGKTKGLKGQALRKHVDFLAQNPTDTMLERATHDAQFAVFQQKTVLGDVMASLQEIPGGKILIPFSRTPSAIAVDMINYSPAGMLKEVITQAYKGKFDQRMLSQAFGRSVVGTGALALGAALLKGGLLSLDYPEDKRERELWAVEGRKEHSLTIGGKSRSVAILGPLAGLIVMGGYIQKSLDETGSPWEAGVTGAIGGARFFVDQTAMTGLSQFAEAVRDPERSFDSWFTPLAGSIVPTLVADIARATDSTERMAYGPVKRILSRVPGAREGLEARQDIFGQDVPRYGGDPWEVMLDPTRPFKVNQDVVVDELRRLWDAGVKVSPTKIGNKKGFDILTDRENAVLWRRSGRRVYAGLFDLVTKDQGYMTADDQTKEAMINNVVSLAKNLSQAEVAVIKQAQGVSMEQMREAKLVNNTVEEYMGAVGMFEENKQLEEEEAQYDNVK